MDEERHFEEYRKHLYNEAVRLVGYIALYRRLHDLRLGRLEKMNVAPGFFRMVIESLFSAIINWVHKLFDARSERGLINFLNFCENNVDLFRNEELQRRRGYPNGHWMLQGSEPITCRLIQEDKARIMKMEALPSFKKQRDKYHAHFDARYFFDPARLAKEAPLTWADLDQVKDTVECVINTYSAAYDGSTYVMEPVNARDVDVLLERVWIGAGPEAEDMRSRSRLPGT